MQLVLFGQTPGDFPPFPDAWLEGAEKNGTTVAIPPDALLERIWPN